MCSVDVIIFYVPRPTFVFGFFIEIEIEINGHEIASKISTTKRAGSRETFGGGSSFSRELGKLSGSTWE